ncbi:hypothetical protein SAMN05421833_115100 [Microbispora rosea]|uniref:DUF2812 domain-containing protein n=1 Tax=Microbispora rosea TaxID=58117 RepID=A0A1N7DQM3_9ACTN|nr:hypothetical protein [Microbispora rosea]GIH49262.1 hypothetical protein Mro03_44410 [Microbispora rosea subsp. rosea]SIR78173.1 hypothetical protein SAMN05421833_115100 [Microbispora rosea]
MSAYLDELAALLRAGGVPVVQAEATVADLASYVAETGGDPEEEFGPVGEFAGQLLAARAPETDATDATEWRWTADIFTDRQMLARLGDQGWEIDRVDHLGRFVSHRDPERPQRWEYRREPSIAGSAPAARLAPEGWEPCGTWMYWRYFKRPRAASVGPAAQLDSPPAAPGRSVFFSRRFYVVLAVTLLAVIAPEVLWGRSDGEGPGFLAGMAVGGCVAIAVLAVMWLWTARRRS